MSKANQATTAEKSFDTDAHHGGHEVAVRARSSYSRSKHTPVTDRDGDVVFYAPTDTDEPGPVKVVDEDHPDAAPRPACGLPCGDVHAIDYMLARADAVESRDPCSYCNGSNVDPATGSSNKSFARVMRYGESWGD